MDKIFPCGKAPLFWSINWSAAVVHLLNAAAMTVLWYRSDNRDTTYRLTETYAPWIPTVNGTCVLPAIKISDEWCLERRTETTSELSLWWLIIGFHTLSFVFQSLVMIECTSIGKQHYIQEVLEDGQNTLRMIEYSISATCMQIAIALLLGVWERLAIMGVACLTVVTMLLGIVAEQTRSVNICVAWFAHSVGWFSMASVWAILGRQFVFTIAKSQNKPPAFVYVIVVVISLLYSIFGVVQAYQLYKTNKMNRKTLNTKVEIAYCLNSLVSKTFLGWMIYSNALVGVAQS